MGRPNITEDQWEMAVTMLANAIRKDAHLRNRARRAKERGNVLASSTAGRRTESSQRYVQGMCDILGVLFAEGPELADQCMEEAYALAMGTPARFADNGQNYH